MNLSTYKGIISRYRNRYEAWSAGVFKRALMKQFNDIYKSISHLQTYQEILIALRNYPVTDIKKAFDKVYHEISSTLATWEYRRIGNKTGMEDMLTKAAPDWNNQIDDYINGQAYKGIRNITDSTLEIFREYLKFSLTAGNSITEALYDLKDAYPQISDARAALIARTETNGAMNFGQEIAAKETGFDYEKVWLNSGDDRVRAWHRDISPVKVGQDFLVNGEYLEYPGDKRGSPENVCNCRCTVIREVI